ncbi:MAG: hypothetical protein L0Y50_01445 [Beijerinckiaceae bacterium]|nr:hypothetical protein [Beijerinckiaceae bacterium]MCI0734937.1 hypothetical protein [Beijerinckiaceae bacterium]
MSYLAPPPMPAPVVIMKDVGGFVANYQTQTEIYRASGREVRLHECRSACTLALSLPNVCVYPDSKLKFHSAYDPRNRQVNSQVTQQLFDSYPAPVQARLGNLTREYKVLRGSELIALGIRDCNGPKTNEPRIMVAAAPSRPPPPAAKPDAQKPLFAGMFDKMFSVFGIGEAARSTPPRPAQPPRPALISAPAQQVLAEIPLPPARPLEFTEAGRASPAQAPSPAPSQPLSEAAAETPAGGLYNEPVQAAEIPLPPPRPASPAATSEQPGAGREPSRPGLPAIITGSQPILPPGFRAYAELDR